MGERCDKMRISEGFTKYMNFLLIKGASKDHKIHVAAASRTLIEACGNKEFAELTLDDISNWYKEMRKDKSENSCSNYISILRMILKFLKQNDVECLDYSLVPLPKRTPSTPDYLTAKEVSKIIASNNNIRTKFIISLLYSSGIRVSELISLNIGQIKNRQFTVIGKNKKERLCFIDSRTEKLMNEYLETRDDSNDSLIVTRFKTRPSRMAISQIVKNAVLKSGITGRHITPHTFRHSFATNFISNNGGIRYLSDLLGHSSLSTTAIYTHIVNNDLKMQYSTFHSF